MHRKNTLPRTISTTTTINFVVALWCSIAAGFSPSACADENVIVTGTRRAADSSLLPYAVTVIDQEKIQQSFARTLPDVLTQTPGVLVQKSANGQGSPFLRGFTGYRTLTLIDGVRYNNSVYRDGPNEYFSLIDFNAVENIEVFGGPTSVLYGSDAIGGTLNLQTVGANHEDEAAGRPFLHGLQRLSFASVDNSSLSRTEMKFGSGQCWGVHLGYSLKNFRNVDTAELGKQHHTGYGERAWDSRVDVDLNGYWSLRFAYQQLDQDDVWRVFSTAFAQSFAGSTVGTDRRRTKDQQRDLGYIRLRGNELSAHLSGVEITLSRQSWTEHGDRIRAVGRRNFESFKSVMFGADIQFSTHLGGLDLVYGVDAYRDSVDSARRDLKADGGLDRIRIQGPVGDDARFTQWGTYVQGIVEPHKRIRLELGSRFTQVSARIGRFEDPITNRAARFSDDWNEFSHSARASFFFEEDHQSTAWVGISESFRAPNIADLSRFGASRSTEFEIAATELDAEKFLSVEVGVRRTGWPLDFSITAYRTRIRDYITSTPTGRATSGLTEVSKQNSASGFVQGIELDGSRAWRNGMRAWGNVTWLEGELETISTISARRIVTEPLSRIMPLTVNFGMSWTDPTHGIRAALDVMLVATADELSAGDRDDTQRIPPGGTPGYELIRLSFEKQLSNSFEIALGITNVLDNTFRSHGSGVNEAGRGAALRLTARF